MLALTTASSVFVFRLSKPYKKTELYQDLELALTIAMSGFIFNLSKSFLKPDYAKQC